MTPEQLATLKAAILAAPDPAVVTARTNGADNELARLYNLTASPAFIVWRTSVPRNEAQGSGFDWTQIDNLTVGQARIWFDALFDGGGLNAADAGQRAGVAEAWKGTAAKVAVRDFVLGVCKRAATKAEKALATGTGTDVAPAVLGFEGVLSTDDVTQAMRS